MKKKECAVIFKKARFLLQICICVGKACVSQYDRTGGGVPGLRLCKGGLGRPSVLHSFSRKSVYVTVHMC